MANSPEIPSFAVSPVLPTAVDTPDRSDHDLMCAVRAGEIDYLGDLFERHHRPLYGFFVRMTRNCTASEDLVQLVFYRMLKYRHTYRDEGKFSAWIYHLARKVVADHFHKHGNAVAPENFAGEDLPDPAPHAADRAVMTDDLALMQVALAQLTLEQRELLTLHRLQNLRHEEIAQLFDCSVGAVKVRIHRALTALRKVYLELHQRGRPELPRGTLPS